LNSTPKLDRAISDGFTWAALKVRRALQ